MLCKGDIYNDFSPFIQYILKCSSSDLKGVINMEITKKIRIRNFNVFTILSILALLAGILFYIGWGIYYGVWYDIGIYSFTIVFIISGIIGLILSLMEKEEIED